LIWRRTFQIFTFVSFGYTSRLWFILFFYLYPEIMNMRKLVLLPVLFFSVTLFAQKKIEDKTLLWRITGNGAKEASYLFGTMHLKDNRLFNFKDSLYTALENCDRLALEFQPDSLAIGLLQQFDLLKYMLNRDDRENEEDKSFNDYVEQKLSKQQIDSLQRAVKLLTGADKINYKKLIARKRLGYDEWEGNEKMPVFMDAWLYNVARRQGKKISGLERLSMQLDRIEEMKRKNLPPDILLSPRGTQFFTEALTTVYLSEDIQKMYDRLIATESAYERELFFGRNLQMLGSIESLIGADKLFIAVGAGHLAGDSGLVWLLRNKGYTVEPVYTQNRKAAKTYQYKAVLPPRYQFKDTVNGYGVRFPNQPAAFELVEPLKMQIYADIGTGLGYFTLGASVPNALQQSDSSGIIKFLLNRLKDLGNLTNEKPLRHNKVLGVEADIQQFGVSESYRVRVFYTNKMMYVFMLWADDKKLLAHEDVNDFFASVVFETPQLPKDKSWEQYTDKEFAFSVRMPSKPKITDLTEKGSLSRVDAVSLGLAMDIAKANYYMFTCNRMAQGYYYPNDSAVFNETQLSLCANLKATVKSTADTMLQGYHARKLDLKINKAEANGIASVLLVNRSGIFYVFIAYNEGLSIKPVSFDTYLNSIVFTPYATDGWAYHTQDSLGIAGWLPGPFVKEEPQADEVTGSSSEKTAGYKIYDKTTGHTFGFYQTTLSPYFWAATDSALWMPLRNSVIAYGDSVLAEKNVLNGNAWGKEWVLLKEGGSAITRHRMLFCGDKKYELVTNIHLVDTAAINCNRLFNELKILQPADTAFVYANKAKQLLMDLRATDSTVKENASTYLSSADFTNSDLPLLYDALLYDYGEKEYSYTSNARILVSTITALKDDTMRLFAERNYEKVAKVKGLQYHLLSMILESRTQEAANVCKQLLLNNPPTSNGSNAILMYLYDSAQLLQNWYPEILQLAKVPSFSPALWRITGYLLDSNRIPGSMVMPYAETFYAQAKAELDSIKANAEYEQYDMSSLLGILAHCNTKKGNELLRTNLGLLLPYNKRDVIVALAKNGIRAPDGEMLKAAADDYWRYLLYNDLLQYKKQAWFPTKYATQQLMAKSYMYNMLDEDGGTATYIGERTALYDGKQQRFYLFKVNYDEEGGESVLAICGPFAMDKTKLTSSYKAVAFSEEPYQKSQIDKEFKVLLYNQ
jgi:uncharacterized protein YbaP (TraB family)